MRKKETETETEKTKGDRKGATTTNDVYTSNSLFKILFKLQKKDRQQIKKLFI